MTPSATSCLTSGVDRRVAVTRACTISVSEICAIFRLSTLTVRPSVSVATSDSVFSAFGFERHAQAESRRRQSARSDSRPAIRR